MMLVHHSRNSEQKQWDETLVLALNGTTKLLRSYLPVLATLEVWGKAWHELMQVSRPAMTLNPNPQPHKPYTHTP